MKTIKLAIVASVMGLTISAGIQNIAKPLADAESLVPQNSCTKLEVASPDLRGFNHII